jgi:hypothetical protein
VAAVPAEPGSPEWYEHGPAAVDREAWSPDPAAFEALLAALVPFRRVVILSGDVHYGFAGSVAYWDRREDVERRAGSSSAPPRR